MYVCMYVCMCVGGWMCVCEFSPFTITAWPVTHLYTQQPRGILLTNCGGRAHPAALEASYFVLAHTRRLPAVALVPQNTSTCDHTSTSTG